MNVYWFLCSVAAGVFLGFVMPLGLGILFAYFMDKRGDTK